MESANPPDLHRLLCLGGGRRGHGQNGYGGDDPRPRATDSKPMAHGIPPRSEADISITIVMALRLSNAPLSGRRASIASARSAAAESSTPEYDDVATPISRESRPRSFDDLVGTGQHRLRNRQPDRLGGFEIDDQLELRRLLHGKVCRLRALEDLVHVDGRALVDILAVRVVAHQAAGLHEVPSLEH